MSISSGFIVLAYEHTFVQVRLSLIVIPDLIREPVVLRHVVGLRVYSTGSRIKSGMTISEGLTRKRVYAFRGPHSEEGVRIWCSPNVAILSHG